MVGSSKGWLNFFSGLSLTNNLFLVALATAKHVSKYHALYFHVAILGNDVLCYLTDLAQD